jgi:hypothetical protein
MTDSYIIDTLGGPTALAAKLGTTKGTVSGWRKRGIPKTMRAFLLLRYGKQLKKGLK